MSVFCNSQNIVLDDERAHSRRQSRTFPLTHLQDGPEAFLGLLTACVFLLRQLCADSWHAHQPDYRRQRARSRLSQVQ